MEVKILAARSARDEQRQRKGEHHADSRRSARKQDGSQQNDAVERIDHPRVAFPGPGLLDTAVDAARKHAIGADDGEGSEEQDGKPQARWQQEPEAETDYGRARSSFD